MDNLTHSLVGLTAAKAGLERLSPAATTLCVLAANAPDADILAALGGRWFYLHHHRGITHSIVGTLLLALLLPILFYIGGRIIARVRQKPPRINFRGLLLASLIASATHPLMDWTNNYGVRPLLPWSAKWYYGDLVFIVDPWLWLGLGGTAFLLTARTRWRIAAWAALAFILTLGVFFLPQRGGAFPYPPLSRALWIAGLTGFLFLHRAKLTKRYAPSLAVAALVLVVVYWGGLALAHRRAFQRAQVVAERLAKQNAESTERIAAMPTLANPLRWQCVAETDRATYRFDVSLNDKSDDESAPDVLRYEKPQGHDAVIVARAAADERAQIFLDFARFPISRIQGDCLSQLLVQFADLRYTEPGQARRGSFSLDVPVVCPPGVERAEAK